MLVAIFKRAETGIVSCPPCYLFMIGSTLPSTLCLTKPTHNKTANSDGNL